MIKKLSFLFLFASSIVFAQNANNPTKQSNDWKLSGNSGTSSVANFIGTTDAQPLVFKTNNIERARIDGSGNLGIGTMPAAKLDVNTLDPTGVLIRGGNVANANVNSQLSFGFSNSNAYRHDIRTRHNANSATQNAIDFFLWEPSIGAGTRAIKHLITLEGTGNVGIGTTAPLNTVHISKPFIANTAGIRAAITSASPATAETAYLAVNAVGDIVRGAAITGGGGGNSLPVSEAQVSNSIAFGKIVGGVKEFTIALNGSNQLTVTRRHSATASTFYFFNNWTGDTITTGKISRSQGTLPLNTAVVVSFDGNGGAARALANNTSVSVILYGDGQVIDVQAWNTGGGIMIRASQVI